MTSDALLVDVKETARLLGISESMVRRMAGHGQLPHVRFGRRVLFSLDGLRQWIRDNDGRDVTAGEAALAVQEADMCSNCVTPWKCNGPHQTGEAHRGD